MHAHAIYLAVIAVLLIVVVCASAKAVRAHRIMTDVEERFGLNESTPASLPRKEALRRYSGAGILRPRTFAQYAEEVNTLLRRAQTLEEFGKGTALSGACQKALTGGKRLRAIILLEVARATSVNRQKSHRSGVGEKPMPVDAGEVALFIEYIHAASLVIDDLPEFDNDGVRRGRPSLHAEVGPATAQMAALSLVSAAFQNVCRQVDWLRDNCPEMKNVDRIGTRICSDISRALGAMGAAGGQYMDMLSPDDLRREYGQDAVVDLVGRKTATFFEIAVITGWLTAGGASEQIGVMREIGKQLGTAFQIADDIGDQEQDAARDKPGWNFADVYGREVAEREVERNLKGARLFLIQCSLWTPLWDEVYAQIRKKMGDPADAPVETAAAASASDPAADPDFENE